jgi:hypothetical protein
VPSSYLEAWVDPETPPHYDGYVHLFDRDGQGHKRKSPEKIMSMPELYTIFEGATRDLTIEHTFGRWEDAFVRARPPCEWALNAPAFADGSTFLHRGCRRGRVSLA